MGLKGLSPFFLMGCLFVLVDGLAMLVVYPLQAAGAVVFENPGDPMNLVFLFLTLMLSTVVILLISRFWKKQLVQIIFLGAIGMLVFYMLYSLLSVFGVPGVWALSVSIAAVAVLTILLVVYPEWYVIDICGVLVGLGSIAMLGISLTIPLVLVLLMGLAVYDALSVYKTKHMIDLADIVLDLKLPVVLVVPKTGSYSLIKETKSLKEKLRDQEEREAFFMGLGDIVMPGILVASTFYNLTSNGLLVALSVILGTLLGFAVLTIFVSKGKPQAGLPYLCSGAISGYLVSSYLLFGELAVLAFAILRAQTIP